MNIPTKQILTNLAGETLKDGDKDFTVGAALSSILLAADMGGKMITVSVHLILSADALVCAVTGLARFHAEAHRGSPRCPLAVRSPLPV